MVKRIKYEELYYVIRTGDLLLWESTTPLGWCISKIINSKITHTGLIEVRNERILIFEAVNLVRLFPLSMYRKKKGVMKIARHKRIDNISRKMIIDECYETLGKAYDFNDIFQILMNKTIFSIPGLRKFKFKKDKENKYICSGHTNKCLGEAGLNIKPMGEFVTPDDYEHNKDIEILYEVIK